MHDTHGQSSNMISFVNNNKGRAFAEIIMCLHYWLCPPLIDSTWNPCILYSNAEEDVPYFQPIPTQSRYHEPRWEYSFVFRRLPKGIGEMLVYITKEHAAFLPCTVESSKAKGEPPLVQLQPDEVDSKCTYINPNPQLDVGCPPC